MIGEITAVIGALNAINGVINTVRETKDNVNSVSKVFSRVTEAAAGIAEVEAKAEAGKIVLTQQEALEISLAKKKVKDYDKQLKDMLYITGNHEVYDDMKKMHIASVTAAKRLAHRAAMKKKSRNDQIQQIVTIGGAVLMVWAIAMMGLFIWLG